MMELFIKVSGASQEKSKDSEYILNLMDQNTKECGITIKLRVSEGTLTDLETTTKVNQFSNFLNIFFLPSGQWKNGMANGKGILVVAQGSRYEGDWINDVQEGYGEEFFTDGTTYQGSYQNGHKHGPGKFTWSDGSYYQGDFFNSSISGKGTLHWKDGREYTGDWQNNKMHGKGTFIWPDGKRYIGDYVNDKKEGFGTYYWSEDKFYEGEWLNSKQHGEGKFVLKGKTLRGQFRYGKLIKRHDEENKDALSNFDNFSRFQTQSVDLAGVVATQPNATNAHDFEEEDKRHHIEKMEVGDTRAPIMA
jgi:hypothetical protein